MLFSEQSWYICIFTVSQLGRQISKRHSNSYLNIKCFFLFLDSEVPSSSDKHDQLSPVGKMIPLHPQLVS